MPLRTKLNDLQKKRLGMDTGADELQDTGGDQAGVPQSAPENTGPKDDRFYYFWDRFCARPKYPKVSVTPSLDVDVEGEPSHQPDSNKEGVVTNQKASLSYDEATKACKSKVRAIAEECKRLNVKYYDRTWDLGQPDTLMSLEATEAPYSMRGLAGVQSVKRVEDIFEKPQFYEDGATANDVCQGTVGDCWFLAAITALSGKPELLERICVDRDEKVGVYGFVFYRDGEWISEVVDDRLALRQNDDKWSYTSEYMVTTDGRKSFKDIYPLQVGEYSLARLPKEFRENLRKGSNALYFSSCRSKNETWLPLLEKAYAKAHGDYQAIEGGFPGEGIEDLTGGVATYLYSEHVLDKDKLWSELTQVNKDFLFGCGSRYGRDSDPRDDEGFVRGHAYTVLEAREVSELRLLKIRNPWGETEWNGAWSDGSKEWTPEMMKELNHTFGDDGIFWISYKDFLRYYPEIDRTRLFDDSWTVTQQWTSVEVPWTADYLSTKYSLSLKEKSPVVLVLSQPDERYFNGLDGRFNFELHFRLYKNGEKTYIARSIQDSGSGRSCSAELDLEAGDYSIYVKINATRYEESNTPEEVIKRNRESRRVKLQSVGSSFDLVHAKGKLRETERAKDRRDKTEARDKIKKTNLKGRNGRRKEREREKLRAKRIATEKERLQKIKNDAKKEKREKEDTEVAEKTASEGEETSIEPKDEKPTKETTTNNKQTEAMPPKATESKSGVGSSDEPKPAVSTSEATVDKTAVPKPEADIPAETKTEAPVSQEAIADDNVERTDGDSTKSDSSKDWIPVHKPGSDDRPRSSGGHPPHTGESKHLAEHSEGSKARITITVDTEPRTEDSPDKKESDVVVKVDEKPESQDDDDTVSTASDVTDPVDDDFDWDDDIDGSVAADSDEEQEVDDLYKDKPWNAVCVIGMKVCCIGANAEIKVLHDEEK